jgi:hypothetical protein
MSLTNKITTQQNKYLGSLEKVENGLFQSINYETTRMVHTLILKQWNSILQLQPL